MVETHEVKGTGTRSIKSASIIKFMMYLAALIFLVSLVAWWRVVHNSPDRVFWGMIDRSLQTSSYGRVVTQSQEGERVRQATMVQTTPEPLANGQTVLERTTNGAVTTRVVTDTVGTPIVDYVRYSAIKTDQKSASGEPLDFRNVIGVWGRTDPTGGLTNGQLYGESVLGIIPTASLTPTERKKLVSLLKDRDVFSSKESTSQTSWYGRTTYTYELDINARAYVSVMKEYAQIIGLNHLDTLNPESYPAEQKIAATISVDSWSRQVTKVVYAGGERSEQIVGHNNIRPLDQPPAQAISVSELQQRLQQ